MAINPELQYPGKINPSTPAYPYGSARNITTPGDGTGTPWEAAIVNDNLGFQQALLNLASLVPSGSPDEARASQYLQALQKIGILAWTDEPTYQAGAVVIGSDSNLWLSRVSQSGNDPVTDDGTNWELFVDRSLPSALKNSAKVSRLKQKLDFDQENCYVLCQGDSTGDADNEWFRRMAEIMAPNYPAYTFRYVKWNHAGGSWDSPITLSVGTGSNVIDFYNGSRGGSNPGYWLGNRNPQAYDGKTFDLIISNYGLNTATSWRIQAERLAEYLFTLRQQQRNSEVLVTIQLPDYNVGFLERSALRADAQRYVSGLFGCQIIDIYNLFINLVASTGGDTSPWYVDDLHPTPEGSNLWAEVAINNAEYDFTGGAGVHKRILTRASQIPNGNIVSWLNGTNDVPTYWLSTGPALRSTVQFETHGGSVRADGIGTGTGVLYFDGADELIDKYRHWGDIIVAARVFSEGQAVDSGKCGKLFAVHSVSTSYTEIQADQSAAEDVDLGWRWIFLLIEEEFIASNTDWRIGIFTGEAGERCSLDRIVIAPSLLPDESDGNTDFTFREVLQDSAFSVPANGGVMRMFSAFTVPVQPGCKVKAIPLDAPAGLLFDAHSASSGNVDVRYLNYTASPINMPATSWTFLLSTDE